MSLLQKYNTAVPRYTSYPTVPYWTDTPSQEQWQKSVQRTFIKTNGENGISLYIHLPFCESLCTYCACNTRITVNHKVEEPYIRTLLSEWKLYRSLMSEAPRLREIHLGGGTPTFFSPENLRTLLQGILADAVVCEDHDFSFEGHPANTTPQHLRTLFDLGFRRVSFGIQDFDHKVQHAINRYQSFEQVRQVTESARNIGYTSVNFDLVYGLPFQNLPGVLDTIRQVNALRPDRIAFYSYAHVPWMRPGQRRYTENDLPRNEEKRRLYEEGRAIFLAAGYKEIGIDHFALERDPLFTAMQQENLHRNFMGYTDKYTRLMVSLGASAIGDTGDCFAQNIKSVEPYQDAVAKGFFPLSKGHMLTDDDITLRKVILDLMCKGKTPVIAANSTFAAGLQRSGELFEDGLISLQNGELVVTPPGKHFLRNICLAFDARYWANQPAQQIFSTVA